MSYLVGLWVWQIVLVKHVGDVVWTQQPTSHTLLIGQFLSKTKLYTVTFFQFSHTHTHMRRKCAVVCSAQLLQRLGRVCYSWQVDSSTCRTDTHTNTRTDTHMNINIQILYTERYSRPHSPGWFFSWPPLSAASSPNLEWGRLWSPGCLHLWSEPRKVEVLRPSSGWA